ncbi:GDSL esterase/lipase At5g03610 [Coffea eugenioides]|uniref:GDSL esterase/lipase At5g03610 n=1 Tax=Coffea eugenioides TaxID=49369 RepID=UPI000F604E19|nr:GDSL esterase/lipase At5g03610 [Coffea eugenioides]
MGLPKLLLCSLLFLFSILAAGNAGVHASSPHHDRRHHHHKKQRYSFRPTKLFVFGDSYADTGNIQKSVGSSWKEPYGITFPGKPAGRFSDGRVLTDYVAKFYGMKSPVAYRWIKYAGNRLRYGVNFAYGGTGVFDTLVLEPNMTTQIDFFEKLLKDLVYNKTDLDSSLFLVTVAGNDYGAYNAKGGTAQGLPAFTASLISQLAVNLKRLHGLGARRIAVAALEPLGCLPRSTVLSSFQQCNVTQNTAVNFHNLLLNQAVSKLNNESRDSAYHVLDLYTTFTTLLENKGDVSGTLKFETPLKPCCMGLSTTYSCGSVDDKGRKMYTVCNDAKSAFFWDGVHPTQAGWHAVSMALKPSLQQIC